MSFLQFTEAMNASSELQVWDNAAFVSEEATTKGSWSSLHPVIENPSESLDSDRCKENLSPVMVNSPVSVKSSIPIKPLHSNGVLGNSQRNPTKILAKNGGSVETPSAVSKKKGCEQDDERKIDAEIEEIENEIKRLSSRLEALRLEKAERIAKTTIEKRGRIVPAKFMEAKQSVKKVEEPPPLSSSVKSKFNRRGVSLGPSEIFTGVRMRPPGKLEMTPVQATQSRRKSCFWKLQEIDESKSAIMDRRKSMTVSPKSRKTVSKIESQKQLATTTVGSKKHVKKESSGVLSLIQPRKLFKDGEKEKCVSTKKPSKPGRVVASRYNQINSNRSSGNSSEAIEAARKRSLPENEKEDGGKKARGNEGIPEGGRLKKRWEIPSEIVVYKSKEEEEKEKKTLLMIDFLPKIKTTRCVDESPRGSGPAKRVAELMGKKRSYFCPDNEDEYDQDEDEEEEDGVGSACEAVSFAEEEGDNDNDHDRDR